MRKGQERYQPAALRAFAEAVLQHAGLPPEPAAAVADGLVEADLFGHTTHGLGLLADYVEEIATGRMATAGGPDVLTQSGAIETWDGRHLPGIWTTKLAVDTAVKAAGTFGLGAVAIRRSHHIACLAAFLEEPARRKFLTIIFSSDPSAEFVAPFGGTRPVLTPNPIAAGIPATPDPILMDVSTSITTAGLCARARNEGSKLPHPWLLTAEGQASDDPNVLTNGGSILPVGGLDHGHKGYALSLLVEALTQGLSGFGRAEQPKAWGAAVFVLAIAPQAFGPLEDFERELNWTADACHSSPPRSQTSPVRLPGELALQLKAKSLAEGVALYPSVLRSLKALAASRGIAFPQPAGTMPG
jgi:LDH2 family malate/lactate/ureidoglycolate dehydrogenase